MRKGLLVVFALILAFSVSNLHAQARIELPQDNEIETAAKIAARNTDELSLYSGEVADEMLEKRVSLRVTNVPISQFLNSISAQTQINFIMGEEFAGKRITASLSKVTAKEALDTLLRVQGLTYQRIGKSNSYIITKRSADAPDMITKIYTLNYIILSGGASGSGGGGSSGGGLNTSAVGAQANRSNSSSMNVSSSLDYGASISRGVSGADILSIIGSALSDKGKIAIDARTNKIIITDVPEVFPQLENIIAELDIKPPQILIEAQIVEVSKTSGMNLGLTYGGSDGTIFSFTGPARNIDLDYVKGNVSGWEHIFPPAGTGTGGTGTGSGTGSTNSASDAFLDFTSFRIVLRSMLTRGDAKYLGKPKVVTLNNQPALIETTRDAAIGTISNLSSNDSSSSSNIITQEAERQEVGLKLRVTPQVNRDGYITLTVEPSYSDVTASAVEGLYDPIKRSASTIVRVKNGQTAVIGGLLSSRETNQTRKVPLLGDIPVIGWLFTSKITSKENTDMMIFITPTISAE